MVEICYQSNMISDFLTLSIRNLRYRRLRSWLTIIGIIIGVGLIVGLIYLGEGMKTAVLRQMQMFGSDLLIILPGEEENPLIGLLSGLELRKKEVEVVRNVPGVRLILPMNTETIQANFLGEKQSILLHGSPWQETKIVYEESQGFGLREGTWPEREEESATILGATLADKRFQNQIRIGDEIIVRGRKLRVAGIFKTTGNEDDDSMMFVSFAQFQRLTGKNGGVNSLIAKLSVGADPELVAEDIKAALKNQPGSIEATVLTAAKVGNIVGNILGIIEIILGSIAVVSLLVGGVGIMNTMYTSVLERTREIGVMKAIGATNSQIVIIFLIESGAVGLLGGIIGAGIGLGLAYLTQLVARAQGFLYLEVTPQLGLLFFILFLTFLFGVTAGVLPARQAAELKPAKALRYE